MVRSIPIIKWSEIQMVILIVDYLSLMFICLVSNRNRASKSPLFRCPVCVTYQTQAWEGGIIKFQCLVLHPYNFSGAEERGGEITKFGFSPLPAFGLATAILELPYSVYMNNRHKKDCYSITIRYSGDLNSVIIQYSNGSNKSNCKMVHYSEHDFPLFKFWSEKLTTI